MTGTATLVAQGALPRNQLDQVERDRRVAQSALASARQEIAALESSLEGAQATLLQANASANATQQDLLDKTVTAPYSWYRRQHSSQARRLYPRRAIS